MSECQEKDITKCTALHKVSILLNECNEIIHKYHQKTDLQIKIQQLLDNNEHYNATALLDDFLHIKYHHHIQNDEDQFNAMYDYLTKDINLKCDVSKCYYIQLHYRDRTPLSNNILNENIDNNQTYLIDLISRIHTFFIHSYDVNKLTLKEINYIEQQLHDSKTNDIKQDCQDD
eukprot:27739_1